MENISNTNLENRGDIETNTSRSIFEKISYIVLLLTIFIAPIIFTTSSVANTDITKVSVIAFGTLISAVSYLISAFKSRNISLPKSRITIASLFVLFSVIASTISSQSMWKSFIGQGFETGTASFMLLLATVSFLVYSLVNVDKRRSSQITNTILASFGIIALFHIIRLFTGPEFMSFNVFQSSTSTVLGKWNDLGIFSAVIALISYFSIKNGSSEGKSKMKFYIAGIASLVLLTIVNSFIIWAVLFVISIVVFAIEFSKNSTDKTGIAGVFARIPVFISIVLVITLVLVFKNNAIIGPMVDKLKVSNTEISLPWQLTMDVAAGSLKESPVFGAGPNRFVNQYLKYKPLAINSTQFWGVEFSNGFGVIPSFTATQGFVGLIAWIIFLIVFISRGYVSLKNNDGKNQATRLYSYLVSLFLLIIATVYIPSHVILYATAIFLGIYMSTSSEGEYRLNRKFAPVFLIVLIAVSAVWIALYAKKTIAINYFQSGITAISQPENKGLDTAEMYFKKALSFDRNDVYLQALSENNILKINVLSQEIQKKSQDPAKPDTTELVKKIGDLIKESVDYTRAAIAIDPSNYYNHISEARISELAATLDVKDAENNALNSYSNAIALNPYNPSLYLSLARFMASKNKIPEAQKFIGNALQLKQNYLEAVFLLAQIQVSQGKTKDAINSVLFATQINPNDATLFFQLGLLYYNEKDYTNATIAFDQAIKLNDQYANARYFLGLSYARLGKTKDAIINFESLAKSNPDNQEVSLILSNLKADKPIFADAMPPIDSKPEKRKSLPIQEKKTTKTGVTN